MGKIFEALKKAEKERERMVKKGGEDAAARSGEDGECDPHLVAYFDRMSPISEQYRTLRTALMGLNPEEPPKSVAITSAMRGEGKSLTTLNLAITFAQAEGSKVAVVDANLRDPSVHTLFGVDNQRGLSDFLNGNVMLELILQRTRHPNLWILPAGSEGGNPTDLLAEKRMQDLVSRLSRDFTFVLIDTPSLEVGRDAVEVAQKTDGTLFVVKASSTPRGLVVGSLENLQAAPAKVLGTVVTHLPPPLEGYGYMPGSN